MTDVCMDAVRFEVRYDPARLLADLAAAEAAAAWIAKPEQGKYLKWSAIPLHSVRGSVSPEAVDLHAVAALAGDCAPTPVLRECPYIGGILASFTAAKLRVRLMRLAAGGRIARHRDRQYGWDQQVLRLHVPIVTHPDVEFTLADRRVDMRPGELWYLDTTRDHEVVNHSPVDRVHLVIDLVNGPEIRAQLSPAGATRS
jgi:quercetin dioxygenase-like cupin family protein